MIREQDPLKQGLKHPSSVIEIYTGKIREQDPLKQGLKLKERVSRRIDGMLFASKIH